MHNAERSARGFFKKIADTLGGNRTAGMTTARGRVWIDARERLKPSSGCSDYIIKTDCYAVSDMFR